MTYFGVYDILFLGRKALNFGGKKMNVNGTKGSILEQMKNGMWAKINEKNVTFRNSVFSNVPEIHQMEIGQDGNFFIKRTLSCSEFEQVLEVILDLGIEISFI